MKFIYNLKHPPSVTIKCSYKEFMTLYEMLAGNVPDGDFETELLSEFEVAQDAVKAAQ